VKDSIFTMNMLRCSLIISMICLLPSLQLSQPLDNKSVSSSHLINVVLSLVRDLAQEVRGYKNLVSEQGKTVEDLMTKHAMEMEEVKMDLKKALDQLDGLKSILNNRKYVA